MEQIEFMYITNRGDVAKIIQTKGVKRVWVDLEYIGKEERQKNMNTVKSNHSLDDVSLIKSVLVDNKSVSELLVRVNPIHPQSKSEINEVISRGADIVMLPMFKTVDEVKLFLDYIDGRVKTCLLFETKESVESIEEIMSCPGIDEVHIGLNDLHLSYGLTFMFELLANGTVERICNILQEYNIPYGFGGLAKVGEGLLPAEKILAEHVRLGSTRAILSRSFCDTTPTEAKLWEEEFDVGIKKLREKEREIRAWSPQQFAQNKDDIIDIVGKVVSLIKKKRGNA